MIFSLWRQYGALNSKPVWDAFEHSIKQAGHTVVHNSSHSDVDVIWSVLWAGRMQRNKQIWQKAHKKQKPIIVIEVGGIRRGETWRLGLNGVNRDAYFAPEGNNRNRADRLGLDLKSWRKQGEYILVCGQHEKSQQWQGLPPVKIWAEETIQDLRRYTDKPIVIRPHPRCGFRLTTSAENVVYQTPTKKRNTYDDYDMQFKGVWAVVNPCSNPGVHAAIAGVPVFVNKSSLASPVGNVSLNMIENPAMPDRRQWLNDLAHKEYTVDEISQGIPLKYLTEKIN